MSPATQAPSQEQQQRLTTSLKRAELDARVFLAETTITMDDLLHLQPGDIVRTAKPANAELTFQVMGRSKFAGRIYQHKGMRVFRVNRTIEGEEPL